MTSQSEITTEDLEIKVELGDGGKHTAFDWKFLSLNGKDLNL